jgi:hypothetical protein
VFPVRCLELNSEGSLLEIYIGAWAEDGGKGALPTTGVPAKHAELGLVKVCDGEPRTDGEEDLSYSACTPLCYGCKGFRWLHGDEGSGKESETSVVAGFSILAGSLHCLHCLIHTKHALLGGCYHEGITSTKCVVPELCIWSYN